MFQIPYSEIIKFFLRKIKRQKCLLVVEDSPGDAYLITEYIRQAGYQCSVASTGEQALGMIRMKNFHLTFVDMRLPMTNGWELVKNIMDEYPNMKIVITLGMVEDLHNIPTGKFVSIIKKPVSSASIKMALK